MNKIPAKIVTLEETPLHLPQSKNCKSQEVTEVLEYANGAWVNLDHRLCYGGKGFVYAF
jgi:hypothetical protein